MLHGFHFSWRGEGRNIANGARRLGNAGGAHGYLVLHGDWRLLEFVVRRGNGGEGGNGFDFGDTHFEVHLLLCLGLA